MKDIEELRECIKENLNKETQVQMRLIDNKNNRVAYRPLTLKELLILETMGIDWHNLRKDDSK